MLEMDVEGKVAKVDGASFDFREGWYEGMKVLETEGEEDGKYKGSGGDSFDFVESWDEGLKVLEMEGKEDGKYNGTEYENVLWKFSFNM